MTVETKDLRVRLGGREILKGIDVSAGAGKLTGVIGPNGSGKSTLLKCIYRTLKPSGGCVYLDGRELDRYSPRQSAQRLAVVAQHNQIGFDFTVGEVVLMGRSPHKKLLEGDSPRDLQLADQALQLVGMASFAGRSFSTLSGGERQRVILARALAQDTPVLILDEPTNHLDIKYQLQLMDLVRTLGRTVIAAIHDLNIACLYCDRLIALKDGQVAGTGTPSELLTPDFIRRVFEVEAIISTGPEGRPFIQYRPGNHS